MTMTFGVIDLKTILALKKKAKFYTPAHIIEEMIRCADEAMIEGKRLGRD